MSRPTVVIDLVRDIGLARDLSAGGVFVRDCKLAINSDCDLVVRGADEELSLPARVVFVDGNRGAGLELVGFSPAMRDQLAAFVAAIPSAVGTVPGIAPPAAAPSSLIEDIAAELYGLALEDPPELDMAIGTERQAKLPASARPQDRTEDDAFDEWDQLATDRARDSQRNLAVATERARSRDSQRINAVPDDAHEPEMFVDAPTERPATSEMQAILELPSFDAPTERPRIRASMPPPNGPTPQGSQPGIPPVADRARQRDTQPSIDPHTAQASSSNPPQARPSDVKPAIDLRMAHARSRDLQPSIDPRMAQLPIDPRAAQARARDAQARDTQPSIDPRAPQARSRDTQPSIDPRARSRDTQPSIPPADGIDPVTIRRTRDSQPAIDAVPDPVTIRPRSRDSQPIDGRGDVASIRGARDSQPAFELEPILELELEGEAPRRDSPPSYAPATFEIELSPQIARGAPAAREIHTEPYSPIDLAEIDDDREQYRGVLMADDPPAPQRPMAMAEGSLVEGENDGVDGEAGDDEEEGEERKKLGLNHSERLRGLSLVEQIRKANSVDPSERMALERMYGKNVWEALLRNQRLTAPEVARIARMGALPRPLIELIVGNGAWLHVPEVRRALLQNPKLGTDQIQRILRLVPKHELKLASVQTAYPMPVRDAAKKMLREQGG
jgi:PilZ domain-containing protein